MGDEHTPAGGLDAGDGVADSLSEPGAEPIDPTVSLECCEIFASFEITPDQGCVLSSVDRDVTVVQHYFTPDHCEVVLETDGDSSEVLRGETIDTAVCPLLVMSDYGASPAVRKSTEDGYVVDAYVADTDQLWLLVDDLKDVSEELTVRRIVDIEAAEESPVPASVDLSELTEKQRETLTAAIREGYFERPRRVSQAELAEQFDISKQAMARRLARAERVVFEQLPLG